MNSIVFHIFVWLRIVKETFIKPVCDNRQKEFSDGGTQFITEFQIKENVLKA